LSIQTAAEKKEEEEEEEDRGTGSEFI